MNIFLYHWFKIRFLHKILYSIPLTISTWIFKFVVVKFLECLQCFWITTFLLSDIYFEDNFSKFVVYLLILEALSSTPRFIFYTKIYYVLCCLILCNKRHLNTDYTKVIFLNQCNLLLSKYCLYSQTSVVFTPHQINFL